MKSFTIHICMCMRVRVCLCIALECQDVASIGVFVGSRRDYCNSCEPRLGCTRLHQYACIAVVLLVVFSGCLCCVCVCVGGVSTNSHLQVLLADRIHKAMGDKADFPKPPENIVTVFEGETEPCMITR